MPCEYAPLLPLSCTAGVQADSIHDTTQSTLQTIAAGKVCTPLSQDFVHMWRNTSTTTEVSG